MAHWKLTLSYDGTGFHGWQVQPGLATVQGTLAAAVYSVAGEALLPQGSGRTDAGVHALAQVASFSLRAAIPPANLQRALNSVLPASIRILAAEPVAEAFHARHSAIRKTYEYRIFEQRRTRDRSSAGCTPGSEPDGPGDSSAVAERICPPFLAPYAWECRWPLDVTRMNEATRLLVGEHDFASFAASDPDLAARLSEQPGHPGTVRSILHAEWLRAEDLLLFRITGSGFLHHMVRNLVGTLVDVGRGSLEPQGVAAILAARDRTAAGPTAPARGLFLVSVDYDEARA